MHKHRIISEFLLNFHNTAKNHGHLALYFRLLSYHFCSIYRAGIYLILHQNKANEFNSLKMTAKIELLVPVLQNNA